MVICSKNVKESQFIVALLIFFLSKELKGKGGEQHFQGREAGRGRKEGGPLACANLQSVAVLWGERAEHSRTPLRPEVPAEVAKAARANRSPSEGGSLGGQSVSRLRAFLQATASPTARGAPLSVLVPLLLLLRLLLYFPAPVPALSPPSLVP